ncbi:MAG: PA0069 family radical SAM protein [Verrucomicrobiae bacterium]|nr:PA0069 family radical SAM protein [Verrucomicrobiae bacterium]
MEKIIGRGVTINPPNRFETLHFDKEMDDYSVNEKLPIRTRYYVDHSTSFITYNTSPDVGFTASINPYRGCEHGCVYCYARPMHEYLGFSSGLDFESRIMIKTRAPELLRKELSAKNWKPQTLALSSATDCYQPIERKLKLTRSCLEVLAEFRNPVSLITKNHLITRDIDVLQKLAQYQAVSVNISLTTLNPDLAKIMEPRTAQPEHRLHAITALAQAGIPVNILMAPLIPGLTDHEIPSLLQSAAQAGAQSAGYVLLRLPHSVKELFTDWLETHFPEKKKRILDQLCEMRQGKLNESQFYRRMKGQGSLAQQLDQLFKLCAKRAGLNQKHFTLNTQAFRHPAGEQLTLF